MRRVTMETANLSLKSKRREPREEDGVSLQPEHEHAHRHTLVVDKSIGLKRKQKTPLAKKEISFLAA